MIRIFFLRRSLPKHPFMNYRFSHLRNEERRRSWDENANLISKENEKIVRFDVFIFFLRRLSSASSSLEVDCKRLISRRRNWIFPNREVLGRRVHERIAQTLSKQLETTEVGSFELEKTLSTFN